MEETAQKHKKTNETAYRNKSLNLKLPIRKGI